MAGSHGQSVDRPCLHSSCWMWWHFSDTSASIFLVCLEFYLEKEKGRVLSSPAVFLSDTPSLPPSPECPFHPSFSQLVPLNLHSVLPHVSIFYLSTSKSLWQQDVISHLPQHFQPHNKMSSFFFLLPPRGYLVPRPQRPPEKFDTQMRSFKFYHSFPSDPFLLCTLSPSIQTFVWAPEMLESKSSECFRICFHMFPSCFLCSPEWRWWWRTRRHAGYLNAVCFMFTFFSVILSNKCIWAWDVGPAK